MPRRTQKLALALALCAMATGAWAADPAPGRYTMTPADGGFLRLDTATGQVSRCDRRDAAGEWVCRSLADERKALETEIDLLARENADLKASVKRLEDLAGIGDDAGKRSGKDHPDIKIPTEEDLDKAMTYVQRMLRKFNEKLKELEEQEKAAKTRP